MNVLTTHLGRMMEAKGPKAFHSKLGDSEAGMIDP